MISLGRLTPSISASRRHCYYKIIKSCIAKYHNVNDGDDVSSQRPMVVEDDINPDSTDVPSDDLIEPTNCCMSGCPNCVWIQYAEQLSKKYANSSDEIQKVIMSKVTDPNMKAFLSMELRCRDLGK